MATTYPPYTLTASTITLLNGIKDEASGTITVKFKGEPAYVGIGTSTDPLGLILLHLKISNGVLSLVDSSTDYTLAQLDKSTLPKVSKTLGFSNAPAPLTVTFVSADWPNPNDSALLLLLSCNAGGPTNKLGWTTFSTGMKLSDYEIFELPDFEEKAAVAVKAFLTGQNLAKLSEILILG